MVAMPELVQQRQKVGPQHHKWQAGLREAPLLIDWSFLRAAADVDMSPIVEHLKEAAEFLIDLAQNCSRCGSQRGRLSLRQGSAHTMIRTQTRDELGGNGGMKALVISRGVVQAI